MDNNENPSRPADQLTLLKRLQTSFTQAHETLTSNLKYKYLKVKEHFGKIDQNEFDKLLEFDFNEVINLNPQIGKLFSPTDELAKLKTLSSAEKKEAVKIFKENLTSQRLAWANCRIFIERVIEFNPESPKQKLMDIVDKFATHYGFTPDQKAEAEKLIDSYYQAHQHIIDLRNRCPDNISLMNTLLDKKIESHDFEIVSGPLSLEIYTDPRGFEIIRSNLKALTAARAADGMHFRSQTDPPISCIVLNKEKSKKWNKIALRHERQHTVNALFMGDFDEWHVMRSQAELFLQIQNEANSSIKQTLIEQFLEFEVEKALFHFKDELLATAKDKRKVDFTLVFAPKHAYDYLRRRREMSLAHEETEWRNAGQKILVDGYQTTTNQAIKAYEKLIHEGNYSPEEAIALLTDVPVELWTKYVNRQLSTT